MNADNNVLFNRDTLKVVGLNRPASPFEVEILNVDKAGLKKVIPTFEDVPKTITVEGEGLEPKQEKLFLLPQEPSEVETLVDVRVKSTDVSEEPVIAIVQEKQPLLGADGNQLEYEKTEVVVTPATYDEDGSVVTEETSEIVGTGLFIKCYTMQEIEVHEEDNEGNPLYWHTKQEPEIELQPNPDLEITSEDERWTEDLEQATMTVEGTKEITFEKDWAEFTYEDVVAHKEAQLIAGTFYDAGKLFEDPQEVADTNLASFKADLGFGFVSIPSGGEFRTVKIPLPVAGQFVGIRTETNTKGLVVEIGRLASNLVAVSKNEVTLDQSASEVYVRFSNPTDKRIDLYSFGLLV